MDWTAWLRLGGQALGDGRTRLAACCFANLIALEPGRASALHNLGEALRLDGRLPEAAAVLRRALRLRPDYARAAAAFGMLRLAEEKPGVAQRWLARAVIYDPGLSAAWHCIGLLLLQRKAAGAVARAMRRAAVLAPEAASLQTALGLALGEDGRHAPAEACLRRAVALAPGTTGHYGSLADVLMRAGNLDGAFALGRRIRRITPAAAEADALESQLWILRGDFRRAAALARRATVLAPDRADNLINAGLAFHCLRRLEDARAWAERARRLDPRNGVARFNLSMTLLALGDFERGWPLYEARWEMGGHVFPNHAPAWDGGPLAGRTILLTAEQGHGDTLHFVRYAALLAARGERVVLHVQPGLKRLLANMPGVAAVSGFGEPLPAHDVCAPLLSLPRLLGTRLDSVPAAVPYLSSAAQDDRRWEKRLAGEPNLKIGLVWAGDPRLGDFKANAVDRRRSLALAAFAPLAAVPGVTFYSLQKGAAAEEAKAPPPGMRIVDVMGEVGDFGDTAALVKQLDLVITVDTSMCHLAGGLARPVWVLSRFDACWRWLDNRETSPWYPTMRLFHQDAPGEWGPVVARVTAELRALIAGRWGQTAPHTLLAEEAAHHRIGHLPTADAAYE